MFENGLLIMVDELWRDRRDLPLPTSAHPGLARISHIIVVKSIWPITGLMLCSFCGVVALVRDDNCATLLHLQVYRVCSWVWWGTPRWTTRVHWPLKMRRQRFSCALILLALTDISISIELYQVIVCIVTRCHLPGRVAYMSNNVRSVGVGS